MGSPPVDRLIAAIASDQHGIIDCVQLGEVGIGRGGVAYRVKRGRLHRLHRGVYAVGHPVVGRNGRWMAAVRAAGAGAVLSHRSAAALLGLRETRRAAIDVTSPRKAHPRKCIDLHRTGYLPPDEITEIDRIPCTTVARTLLDLAEVLQPHEIQRVLERVVVSGQFDLRSLNDVIERHPGRRGAAALRRALGAYDTTMLDARSELERRFIRLCSRFELPRPAINVPIQLPAGGIAIADALWRRERLIVETDGRETHEGPAAFERDRHRDAQLMLAGYRVARFTWRQVTRDPAAVAATVRGLLDAANGSDR